MACFISGKLVGLDRMTAFLGRNLGLSSAYTPLHRDPQYRALGLLLLP